MNYILFDDNVRNNLLPFTFLRTVADIRVGILTIREKWEKHLGVKTSSLTEGYLSKKYPIVQDTQNILINGSVFPNERLVEEVKNLGPNQVLVSDETIIAMYVNLKGLKTMSFDCSGNKEESITTNNLKLKLNFLWDIFRLNDAALREDYLLLTKGRNSHVLSKTNKIIGNDIFIEKGANIECAVLNSTDGPIYIGHDAEIMEGSLVRGPFALCDHAVLKMGAKIYGGTTIGPYSKVGGEVSNSVVFGYSNKAHDGFLGNSVIGEWCNIGADSNNSNLKNNYEEVKLWNYATTKFENTGMQFCGLIMGDHSKCGINTMFNTGTVVGVSASIFGAGFQRNFIPSFSWGGVNGFVNYEINKAIDVAKRVMTRRNMKFDEIEDEILRTIYDKTLQYKFI
ncbi:MAG: GlmU family protein [Bacteroidales bacterium]|nr:GlmU family protein [Bacteroidales bacterium]